MSEEQLASHVVGAAETVKARFGDVLLKKRVRTAPNYALFCLVLLKNIIYYLYIIFLEKSYIIKQVKLRNMLS